MSKGGGSFKRRGITALAWSNFAVGATGGALIAGSYAGKLIRGIFAAVPLSWLASVAVFVGVLSIAIDIFIDGTPNQVAIWGALAIPSVATASPGSLGNSITTATQTLLDVIGGWLAPVIGTGAGTGLAVAATAAALLMMRRVNAKAGGGR